MNPDILVMVLFFLCAVLFVNSIRVADSASEYERERGNLGRRKEITDGSVC